MGRLVRSESRRRHAPSPNPELVDGAVAQRLRKGLVHTAVLVEEGEPVELGRHDGHLEVVTTAGAIEDLDLERARERGSEKRADRLGLHPRPC